MAQPPSVISSHYPYLPTRVTIRGHSVEEQALVDTGFTGYLALPAPALVAPIGLPDTQFQWELADSSIVAAPIYFGTVEIVGLPVIRAAITVLGHEFILGRGILDHFRLTVDHGRQVVAES